MSTKTQTNAEAAFCGRFSPSIFVAYVNASIELSDAIERELREALQLFYDDVKADKNKKINVVIDLDTDKVDETIYTGEPNKLLDRRLWRQSRFFQEIKKAVVVAKKTTVKLVLHAEEGVVRTAVTIDPMQLDTFNRYVILHVLPYIKNSWIEATKDENAARLAKITEEVVLDKLGVLRTQRKQISDV